MPEPSGNVVSRFVVQQQEDGGLRAKHITYDDAIWTKREFLACTDERFRPINCNTGPDGCLYIVDMYRGILQHRVYVTSFLRKQILERMDAIIEFAELGDFIDEPIATYSAGMIARLGFSTAFQIDPDVLLIDEVLGVGDAAFVEKSAEVLREKIRSKKTVVLVSHSAHKLRQLCDRAVWIHDGTTRAEGKTGEVIDAYEAFLRDTLK